MKILCRLKDFNSIRYTAPPNLPASRHLRSGRKIYDMDTTTDTTPRRRGRPEDPENKRKPYCIKLSKKNREYLETIPKGQRSALVNSLIDDHRHAPEIWNYENT